MAVVEEVSIGGALQHAIMGFAFHVTGAALEVALGNTIDAT